MKKRIISMVLVVVMLALMLVSCGYKFTNKDMTENAKFADGVTLAQFKEMLKNLEVEDAEFGNDTKTKQRNDLVNDYIYKVLESAVKTTTTSLQLKDGEIDDNDIVVYAYYAVYTRDVNKKDDKGNDVKDEQGNVVKESKTDVIYVAKMTSSPTVKIGYSDETLSELDAGLRDALQNAIANENDFTKYVYDTKGNIVEYIGTANNVKAYVTYTKTYYVLAENDTAAQTEGETETAPQYEKKNPTVKYELITLDPASEDFLVKSILTTKDGKGSYSFNTKIPDTFTDKGANVAADGATDAEKDAAAKDDITYSDITVHFAVENTPNTVINFTYEVEDKFETDDFIGYESTKLTVDKGAKLSYYAYPLYYFDVADLTAEEILTNDSLTKELLDDAKLDELLKDVSTKKEGETKSKLTAMTDAYKAFKDAKTAFETADETLNGKKDGSTTGEKGAYAKAVIDAINAYKTGKTDDEKAAIDALADLILTEDDKSLKDILLDSTTPNDDVKKVFENYASDKTDAEKTTVNNFSKAIIENSTVVAKSTLLGDANKKYTEAYDALNGTKTAAQAAYDAAVATAIAAAKDGKSEEEQANITAETVKDVAAVKEAKAKLDAATIGKKAEYEDAKKALFTAIGDDTKTEKNENNEDVIVVEKTAEEKVMEKYLASVMDMKIADYEDDMTTNIGKAIWALMNDEKVINVFEIPEKAIDDIADRMYEIYEFEFYDPDGTKKVENVSLYQWYTAGGRGGFKKYLQDQTQTTSYEAAKAKIREDAKEYVREIVVIHFVAEALGLELDKSEIKEYKGNGYKSAKETYGDINIMAAVQFNKLFDTFLEVEMTEKADGKKEVKKTEDGKKIYKNDAGIEIGIGSYKAEKTSDAE